jgi:hypothetical protein
MAFFSLPENSPVDCFLNPKGAAWMFFPDSPLLMAGIILN